MTNPAKATTGAVNAPAGWDDDVELAQVGLETADGKLSDPWYWKAASVR